MRSGTFVEIGKIVCLDQPVQAPQDGELLVRTELASICGSDLHIVMDGVGGMSPDQAHPGYPGHEGVGEVIESRHPDFAVGDRVLTAPDMGVAQCFSEMQIIPGQFCVKLPECEASAGELLMAQQLGTVIFALRQFPTDVTGKNVVILGSGSAGQFHTFMMKRRGAAKVITVDPVATRLEVAKAMGADVIVDPTVQDVRAVVKEETGGAGADYLIEAVGRRDSLLQSSELAGMGASMLWFGLPDSNEPVPIDFNLFFRKKLSAASTYGAQTEDGLVSFRSALDLIANGEIDVSQVVSHTLPVERIEEAMVLAHERTDGALKISVSFE